MPRIGRIVIPGVPHHVTQRGNRGEDVFFCDDDRLRYLELLVQYSAMHALAIHAYCLMTNHLHLIVVPRNPDSLAAALKPVHLRYAQELNRRSATSGYVWGGRFFSCPLDRQHFWSAVRYVERNPVRARIVRKAQRYRWSSAPAHCGLRKDALLSRRLEKAAHVGDWSAWLREAEDPKQLEQLRACTRTGRPAGNAKFVKKLERACGRILRPKPRGRPRKKKKRG